MPAEKEKFWQTADFAIVLTIVSLAITAILTVLATRMKNLSWLFILAWIFLVPACLIVCRRFRRKWALFVGLAVLIIFAFIFFWLNNETKPTEVRQEPVFIQWTTPAAIDSTTPLSAVQLNAKAVSSKKEEVPGEYVYNPTIGATLLPGTDTLSVSFTPSDMGRFLQRTQTVSIAVKPVNSAPPQASEKRQLDLRGEVNLLATQILEYDSSRFVDLQKIQGRMLGQVINSSLVATNRNGIQAELDEIPRARQRYYAETQEKFLEFYWPQVVSLEKELVANGVDVSIISNAVATQGPRSIGLRLSTLSDRIGKHGPFLRDLNPLERKVLSNVAPRFKIQIYAYSKDQDSQRFAKVLQQALVKNNPTVGPVIRFDPNYGHSLVGVRVTYPFGDVASMDTIAPLINDSGFDAQTLIETPAEPLPKLSNGQPDVTVRIEVWPDPTRPE